MKQARSTVARTRPFTTRSRECNRPVGMLEGDRALGAVLLGAVLGVCAPMGHAQNTPQLFQQNCASCHGDRGQGGSAMSMLDGEWFAHGTDRELFWATKGGIVDSGMPAYDEAFTDEQIWAFVVFIREQEERARRARTPAPGTIGDAVESQHHSYTIEEWIGPGELGIPWSICFFPPDLDDEQKPTADTIALLTEREGRVRFVKEDGSLGPPIRDVPQVLSNNQGGMLDVAIDPDFADNGWVYLAYTHGLSEGRRARSMTRLARGRIVNNTWTDEVVIWTAAPEHYTTARLHYGGRMEFAPDGTLYFAIGDRGNGGNARDLNTPIGKVHRINADGSIPEDNPFAQSRRNNAALASIWSIGHRNPQGLAFGPDGALWSTEHGPRGGDEINIVERGEDYGWVDYSFGINYSGTPRNLPAPDLVTTPPPGPWVAWLSEQNEGAPVRTLIGEGEEPDADRTDPFAYTPGPVNSMVHARRIASDSPGLFDHVRQPVFQWTPSIAACGLDVSTGGVFPGWEGDLVAGGLAGQIVERVRIRKVNADGTPLPPDTGNGNENGNENTEDNENRNSNGNGNGNGEDPGSRSQDDSLPQDLYEVVERETLLRDQGRVRDVEVAPDGTIYVLLERPGRVWKLVPNEN